MDLEKETMSSDYIYINPILPTVRQILPGQLSQSSDGHGSMVGAPLLSRELHSLPNHELDSLPRLDNFLIGPCVGRVEDDLTWRSIVNMILVTHANNYEPTQPGRNCTS